VPRRTWLDSKIDVFLEELDVSGMHLDRQRAGELITGQVRAVAALMAVTEATARSYLGEEIITDMARRMLFEVAGERPGADLLAAPRTVPLPLALVGITVAALAEAMQVRAANGPPDHLRDVITTYAQTLAGFGQITADAGPGQAGDPAEILFPPASLRRAARYIRRRRPGRERRQAPGRGSRDGTPPAGRDPAPRRRRTVRAHGRRLTRHIREPGQFPQGARRSIVPAGQGRRRHVHVHRHGAGRWQTASSRPLPEIARQSRCLRGRDSRRTV